MSDHLPISPPGKCGVDCAALLDTVSDLVMVVDEDGVVRYLNSSSETVLGYPAGEGIGREIWDLVHPEDLAPLRRKLTRRLRGEGGPGRSLEVRGASHDGSWRNLEVRVAPFSLDDGAPAVVVTARDLTELRRVEDQLRQAQKMEALGLLASGVAHDFNNLLTGIRGYADLLSRDMTLTDPRRHDVEEIRKAAYRATTLTRQLLAFSRRREFEPQIIDPAEVITDLEKMLRRLIYESIELRTTVHEDAGAIAADRSQLEQVVINLALNGRDAMPDGGVLEIEVGQLVLDQRSVRDYQPLEPGRYVQIRVTDTGSGMDEETRRQIFEPFFTTKEPGKGTGLGLSTVDALARKSGGIVTVETTPGRGSSFRVILPRVQLEAGTRKSEEKTPRFDGRGSETVLLVEDEAVVRNLMYRVLQLKGYRVLTACDGREALQIAERFSEEIQLLISDIYMPRMGGVELARRLVDSRPGLRVLFISGHAGGKFDPGEIGTTRIAYADKPFTPESLVRKVREFLDAG